MSTCTGVKLPIEVSLDEFRDYKRKILSDVSPIVDQEVDTREKFDAMIASVEKYYLHYISAEPILRFAYYSDDHDMSMVNGALAKNEEYGVHSIGLCSFDLTSKKENGLLYLDFDCVISHGKFNGYFSTGHCGVKYDGKYYIIKGVTKDGQLNGYCEVTTWKDDIDTRYEGLFEMGNFVSGTITIFKIDHERYDKERKLRWSFYDVLREEPYINILTRSNIAELVEKHFKSRTIEDFKIILSMHQKQKDIDDLFVELPKFDFDLSTAIVTKPIYLVDGRYCWKGSSCCSGDW